ncbi:hypothetical protein FRC10_003464 [Ceratobasidium sp. 414]|nr:hypothetical protein FRC10_003464 [Ceratobasidium sp. 414]
MGSCSSCCGRRRSATGEREPLLPKTTEYVPSKAAWDTAANALGALSAGKMPTQRQLDAALNLLLSSNVLKVGATSAGALSAHGRVLVLDVREIVQSMARIGMEKNGEHVVEKLGAINEVTMSIADDLIQDVIWQYRSMSAVPVRVDANWHNQSKLDINVDTAVNHLNDIPTVEQAELVDDSRVLAGSLRTLFSLLFTSAAFRLLISDILVTTREILADTASDVAAVAAYVETKAEDVEHTVRPDPHEGETSMTVEDAMSQAKKLDNTVRADLEDALKEAEMKKHVIEERLADESPDRVKQTIVERIEVIVQQAQGVPKYRSSLQTILTLCEKYAHITAQATDSAVSAAQSAAADSTIQASASVDPTIEIDPHLKRLLGDLRTLLERFAGGYSLSPLGDSMKQFLAHLVRDGSSGVSDLLRDTKIWLNKALETPGWLTTRPARAELDALYDRTKNILNANPPWRSDLQNASVEASAFSDHLKRDAATQQLLGTIDALGAHIHALGLESVRFAGWRQLRAELWRDAIGWLLPRVLAVLKAVPLPRVEMKSDMLDAVVDDVTFRAPSFVPDHIRVENWSEVRVLGSDAVESRDRDWVVEGDSTLRVRIDGLRITAHEIAYFFHLKTALLGYRDNGLLSAHLGHRSSVGQGMKLDISLETDLDPSSHTAVAPGSDTPPSSFFRVKSATVDVPGLDFTLARTHHWILNGIAQPLLGPIVRAGMRYALSQSVRVGLEALDRKAGEVYAQAKAESEGRMAGSEPGIWDWLGAFMKGQKQEANGGAVGPDEDEVEESESEGGGPEAQTETQVTMKGVIRTTHQPATETQSGSEAVLAIGVAEQILPGLGGPEDGGKMPEAVERAGEAVGEVQSAAWNVAEEARGVRENGEEAAADMKHKSSRAAEVVEERRKVERKRKGWKCKAFDI